MSAGSASRPTSSEPYDFGTAIDPTLEAALNAQNGSTGSIPIGSLDGTPSIPREALYPARKSLCQYAFVSLGLDTSLPQH